MFREFLRFFYFVNKYLKGSFKRNAVGNGLAAQLLYHKTTELQKGSKMEMCENSIETRRRKLTVQK